MSLVEQMARCFEIASDAGTYDPEAMRGALLWLAYNFEAKGDTRTAAALRQAAGGGDE